MFISRKKIEELERKIASVEVDYARLERKHDKLEKELEITKFMLENGKDAVVISGGFDGTYSFVKYIYVYDGELKTATFPLKHFSLSSIEIIAVDAEMAIIKDRDIYCKLDKKQCVVVEIPCPGDCKETATASVPFDAGM